MSGEISLETQFVPTLLNGITSCTGLIVGFTITVIVITISQFKNPHDTTRIAFTLLFLLFSVGSLFGGYTELMHHRYYTALETALYGLVLSFVV